MRRLMELARQANSWEISGDHKVKLDSEEFR